MPERWACCRPLSGLPSGRDSVPWGRPRCWPAGGLEKAAWAAGPGQAWAGSVSRRQPGLLRQEGDPSLGGEWDHAGAPYGSRLGITVTSWGPLRTSLSTYCVPGIVVAAGPSEQGHIFQS